ncbi:MULTISPECIES: translation initiation factor IF-2 subunit beta [Sulfolobaceae]|uniref:Translation initiation factor 2 subunit beta n=2 Tax=Sulfurisphaera TaxID=69655 RepID=A0A650CEA7_SULOH|nr:MULTISPECIES: translation initiation factor IF-2 subunit beta [Sulfolobaceae]QGR16171.1 translation initiation factor IF-2 subunit beta [Sulfurisphaera ohwakuensis]QIW23379.1 translation initiation factor IF-2 subunit beta [Sulfolobus sp. S-194]HII74789.1 translation initiation factor IF-2 subunit beta [Sulfurisphaera tokodaii]
MFQYKPSQLIISNLYFNLLRLLVSTEEEYIKLLDRLYSKLPERVQKVSGQSLPNLIILSIGNNTIIKNFSEYCDRIRREDKLCAKFILKELAAPGNVDENGQLVIQGKFSSASINKIMERFIKTYVQCSTCKSLDTVLIKEKKAWYISCLACGAKTPVKPL